MHLIDTQFIFGLRKSDKHFQNCSYILKNHGDKLCYSTISLFETMVVMMTQGKDNFTIKEFISTIKDILNFHKVPEIELRSQYIINSLSLRMENPELSFFDSILLAIAEINSFTILGDDSVFTKVKHVSSIYLSDFILTYSADDKI